MLGLRYGTVALSEYTGAWARAFHDERTLLAKNLPEIRFDVEHIGSTAVPDLKAKPILDIAVGIADQHRIEDCVPSIEALGYLYRGASAAVGHVLVREISDQVRTHHVHIVHFSDEPWESWLTFRDYLRQNLEAREAYATEKEALARRYPLDRNAYTEGKNQVVERLLTEARATLTVRRASM